MSADLMRRAATKARELADYAPDSPWLADVRDDGRAWIDVADDDHAWAMQRHARRGATRRIVGSGRGARDGVEVLERANPVFHAMTELARTYLHEEGS